MKSEKQKMLEELEKYDVETYYKYGRNFLIGFALVVIVLLLIIFL